MVLLRCLIAACVALAAVTHTTAAEPGSTAGPADAAAATDREPRVGADPAALFRLGLAALDAGKAGEAVRHWTGAARAGHAGAAYNLGVLFEQGIGTTLNLQDAGLWYLTAAQAGDPDAHLALARLYLAGTGLPRSVANARFWLTRLSSVQSEDAAVQALVQEAARRLASLERDELLEYKFEGGRFLFKEMVLPRCVIALQGRITRDASREFHRVVARAKSVGCTDPWIALESPGGSLRDGIDMGTEVFQEGYSTVVSRSCASACALIFMAGRERLLLGRRARIGLHQAGSSDYSSSEPRKTCYSGQSDSASKLKRRYLHSVLPEHGESVFQRAMKTSCHSIEWIAGTEALQMGIATKFD